MWPQDISINTIKTYIFNFQFELTDQIMKLEKILNEKKIEESRINNSDEMAMQMKFYKSYEFRLEKTK